MWAEGARFCCDKARVSVMAIKLEPYSLHDAVAVRLATTRRLEGGQQKF